MKNKTIKILLISIFLTDSAIAGALKDDLGNGDPCGPMSGVNCLDLEDVDFSEYGTQGKDWKNGGGGYALACGMKQLAGSDDCADFMTDEAVDRTANGDKDDKGPGTGIDPEVDADSDIETDVDVDVDIDVDTETDSVKPDTSPMKLKKIKKQKAKQKKVKKMKKQRRNAQ